MKLKLKSKENTQSKRIGLIDESLRDSQMAAIKAQLENILTQVSESDEVGFPANVNIETSLNIIWDILDHKDD